MHEFEVWAPTADAVGIYLEGSHAAIPMQREGHWWRATVAEANAGTRYRYSINEQWATADPRSEFQPEGVHGLSEVVDHSSFEWSTDNWADTRWTGFDLPTAVVYEMHIGTFSEAGTFTAAIEHLDHLVNLGVDAVEVMPVAEFPGRRGWGYDGVDLYAPHHGYGGPAGLKAFVMACHQRGLAVILDVVYNHFGPDGSYVSNYGPYFTHDHQTPWGDAINYDGDGSSGVRAFVLDNVALWLDTYRIDGLRLDAVHSIVDDSQPHILAEIVSQAKAIGARRGFPAWVIAESDLNDPVVIEDQANGGYGADAQWSDDFHHSLHSLLTGELWGYYQDFGGVEPLVKALNENFAYSGQYSKLRDAPRGKPATSFAGTRFMGYLQNHDQIGNRAAGDRMGMLVDQRKLYIGAALVLLGPFIPMIFQGEEWDASTPFLYFTSHENPELGEAVSEGRKTEFAGGQWDEVEVPDPQSEASFADSKLKWDEVNLGDHGRRLAWHRSLISLRHSEPAFTSDACRAHADGQLVFMERANFRVVVNLGDSEASVEVPGAEVILQAGDVDYADRASVGDGDSVLKLGALSVAVLRLDR